tara:strand:- start:419 stop:592 length:174 start_codon:yes stop_codon:yes gene_type:complete
MSGAWIAYRKAKKEIEILKTRIEDLEKEVDRGRGAIGLPLKYWIAEESHSHREEEIE